MLPSAAASIVRFGEFTFDRGTRLLRRGADEVPLPPRVLGVLELLLERAGDVVPRQAIIDSVWKDAFVTDTSLAEAVSFLRQALGDDPQSPTYIQTVHRRGYRFVAQIAGAKATLPQPAAIDSNDGPVRPSIGGALVPWSVAVFCALAAVLAIWQLTHRETPLPPIVRTWIDPSPGTSLDTRGPALAISPDGSRVAFVACGEACDLYVRQIDRLDNVKVAGTGGASAPFFSPDGRWVGFFADGKLKKVALSGGTPIVIADAPQTFGAAWLPDNAIVFADSRFTGLKRVSDAGGPPVMLTRPAAGELGHAWPDVLDSGRAIVFTAATSPADGDAGPIAVVPYEPGAPGRVRGAHTTLSAAESARAAGPDYIAYTRRDELYAIPFDRTRLIAAGNEQPIGPRVAPLQFAISRSGALVFGPALVPLGADPMIWTLGSEPRLPLTGMGRARAVTLSPDGRRVAIVSTDDASSDIWVRDLERRTTTRITHGGINASPIWSADSTTLYYAARPSARFEVWRRDAAATSPAMSVAARDDAHLFPTSVVGDRLVFTAANQGTSIWMMPTVGGPASGLVDSAYDDVSGVLSPDRKLLAYQSDDSGRWEIYLLRLSDKRRTSVSSGGGVAPFWAPDGAMLYYTSGTRLMGATVKDDEPSTAAPISSMPGGSRPIGIAPDGVVRLTSDVTARPDRAVLTLEWGRELRQLLGPPGTVLPR